MSNAPNGLPNQPTPSYFNWNSPPAQVTIERLDQRLVLTAPFKNTQQLLYGIVATVGTFVFVGYLIYGGLSSARGVEMAPILGGVFVSLIGWVFLWATLWQFFAKVVLTLDWVQEELVVYSGWGTFSHEKKIPLEAIVAIEEDLVSRPKPDENYIPQTEIVIHYQTNKKAYFGKQLTDEKRLYMKRALKQILADNAAGVLDNYLADDFSEHLID